MDTFKPQPVMTNFSLSFGTRITSSNDALRPVSLADVLAVVTTDAALQTATERLRRLGRMDKEAVKTVKTRVPYVVGSTFGPQPSGESDLPEAMATATPAVVSDGQRATVRRTETFVAAHYFVLDLDHCPGLNGAVPDAIRQNDAVALAFVSPGGEGLKLFFRLDNPCTDPRRFTAAYRNFASDFGSRHRFASSLDLRTSDVTRACFLAHDATAHHNPDALPIDWQAWLTDADAEIDLFGERAVATLSPAVDRPINEAAYRDVLRQINPRSPVRREKQVHVPDELLMLEPVVRTICGRLNWELRAVEPLNYGLKFVVRQGCRTAELNVCYGKRGFSLVRSPKTGTDPALSDLLYAELFALLFPTATTVDVLMPVSMN